MTLSRCRHHLAALSLTLLLAGLTSPAHAMIFVKIPGLGDASVSTATFEKPAEFRDGGQVRLAVADIDDRTRARLFEAMLDGEPFDMDLSATSGDARATYLKYKLSRCFVKSWSTSGDAGEVAIEEVVIVFEGMEWH